MLNIQSSETTLPIMGKAPQNTLQTTNSLTLPTKWQVVSDWLWEKILYTNDESNFKVLHPLNEYLLETTNGSQLQPIMDLQGL